jgi:DNA-directed RNA polymerase specialized sigma24 family protein
MTDQMNETSQLALDEDPPAAVPAGEPAPPAVTAADAGLTAAPRSREDSSAGTRAFFTRTKSAVQALRRAQDQRARLEGLAEERRNRAEVEYRAALGRAAAVEARAWQTLLGVPGVTAQTAATLCGVSVATVHRRVKEASHG